MPVFRLFPEESPTEAELLQMEKIESATYSIPDTINHRRRIGFMKNKHVLYSELIYWCLTIIIAVVVGLVTTLTHFSFQYLGSLRLNYIQSVLSTDPYSVWKAFGVYAGIILILVIPTTLLVTFVAPASGQSGVPGTIAYLNGAKIRPSIFTSSIVMSRIFGITAVMAANLPSGAVGPLIHIGSSLGSLIMHRLRKYREKLNQSSFHPFNQNSFDADERDFIAIGAGCGISAAFSAPVGGLMFIIEEASSFFELTVVARAFFACIIAYWISLLFDTVTHMYSPLSARSLNPLCDQRSIHLLDGFWFVIMGIIGGLLGATFNKAVVFFNRPQKYLPMVKWKKMLETIGFAILIAAIYTLLPSLFSCQKLDSTIYTDYPSLCSGLDSEGIIFSGYDFIFGSGIDPNIFKSHQQCTSYNHSLQSIEKVSETINGSLSWGNWNGKPGLGALGHIIPKIRPKAANDESMPISAPWAVSYTCPSGEFNPMASLLLSPLATTINLLFIRSAPNLIPPDVLIAFLIVYTSLIIYFSRLALPGGNFIPTLIIGATYGRLIGMSSSWTQTMSCNQWIYFPVLSEFTASSSSSSSSSSSCLPVCQSATDPMIYAIVGAASMMGGVGRYPLFLAVVMIELTDDLSLMTPVCIGTLVAVWIGNLFNSGFFDSMINVRGFPYLPGDLGLEMEKLTVERAMSSPAVTISQCISRRDLKLFLKNPHYSTHHGFPVVRHHGPPVLIGIISRNRLERILLQTKPGSISHQEWQGPKVKILSALTSPSSHTKLDYTHHDMESMGIIDKENGMIPDYEEENSNESLNQSIKSATIIEGGSGLGGGGGMGSDVMIDFIDLYHHMDLSPFSVSVQFSLSRAFSLFKRLGLRHLTVVDQDNLVVGMLTRKNFSPWRYQCNNNNNNRMNEYLSQSIEMSQPKLPKSKILSFFQKSSEIGSNFVSRRSLDNDLPQIDE